MVALQLTLCLDFKRQREVLCREARRFQSDFNLISPFVLGSAPALGRALSALRGLGLAGRLSPFFLEVFAALLILVLELSPYGLGGGEAIAGLVLGGGVSFLALLRGRMVLVERRFGLLPDRLLRHYVHALEGVSMRSSVISAQGAEVPLHNSSVTPTAQA